MTQERTVLEHFDRMGRDGSYARFYETSESLLTHDFLARRARIQEFLVEHVLDGQSVLDLGCGTGPMVEFFAKRRVVYHGVDVAQGMLDSIEGQFRDKSCWDSIHLKVGSCNDIPYGNKAFDLVLAVGLLDYLDDMQPAIAEFARVTKPGGIAVVTIPNRDCLNRIIMRNTDFITRLAKTLRKLAGRPIPSEQGIVRRELAPGQLDSLMEKAGFAPAGLAFYDYKLICYPLSRLFPNMAYGVNRRIENRAPGFFANGYIGYYRKRDS